MITNQIIQINNLNDEGLIVKKPIAVELTSDGDQIIAAFRAAEIISSGDTVVETIDWLKDMIASTFRTFLAERKALSPFSTRQLKILEEHIEQRKQHDLDL